MRLRRGSIMTTHSTHDPHARPRARSAAGFIESEAIAHRAYELFEERGRRRDESSMIGSTPNTN